LEGGFMRKLSEDESLNVVGGSISSAVGIGMIVSATIIFLSGIIEGFSNPRRCNIEGN